MSFRDEARQAVALSGLLSLCQRWEVNTPLDALAGDVVKGGSGVRRALGQVAVGSGDLTVRGLLKHGDRLVERSQHATILKLVVQYLVEQVKAGAAGVDRYLPDVRPPPDRWVAWAEEMGLAGLLEQEPSSSWLKYSGQSVLTGLLKGGARAELLWRYVSEQALLRQKLTSQGELWESQVLPEDPLLKRAVLALRAQAASLRGAWSGVELFEGDSFPAYLAADGSPHLDVAVASPYGRKFFKIPLTGQPAEVDPDYLVLQAIYAALNWLVFANNQAAAAPVVHTPAWERGLAQLDSILEAEPEAHLLWEVASDPTVPMPMLRQRGKKDWLKPRPAAVATLLKRHDLDDADRELVELLEVIKSSGSPRMVGRMWLKLAGRPNVVDQDGRALEVVLDPVALQLDEEQDHVALKAFWAGRTHRGAELERWLMSDQAAIATLDSVARKLYVSTLSPKLRAMFSQRIPVRVPKTEAPALLARAPRLERVAPVRYAESLGLQRVPSRPRVVVRCDHDASSLQLTALVRPHPGLPALKDGDTEIVAQEGGRTVIVVRDREGEKRLLSQVLGPIAPGLAELGTRLYSTADGVEVVARLVESPQVDTEWAGPAWSFSRAATSKDLRLGIKSHADWFQLQGSVNLDGVQVALVEVLEAVRSERHFVRLDGERWLRLGESLMAELQSVAAVAFSGQQGLEITPAAAPALMDLRDNVDADARWLALQQKLVDATQYNPELPAGLQVKLRPYQEAGWVWMARLAEWGMGAVLADDMGLGKTLQALAMLLHRAALGPALVVAPVSVAPNWLREAQRFAPGLRFHSYRDSARGLWVNSLSTNDVVVVSYAMFRSDAEAFIGRSWATLVLDEAQFVKNFRTQTARVLGRLKADWRVGLTGTPIENHSGELWSIFRIVAPGILGSWEQFSARFGRGEDDQAAQKKARDLSWAIRPFVLRRTKAQVAKELPPKTEVRVDVVLSVEEVRLYDAVRLLTVKELADAAGLNEARQRFRVLTALTRLRQLACHPKLYHADSTVPSSKEARVVELLRALWEEGQRALVFSQFARQLHLLRARLDAENIPYLYLDGATHVRDRQDRVDRFQRQESPFFLISLRAGGAGLNLTAADNVIHLDPWWNPAVEDQATDRAHRIGQDKPVTVYRLVAQGTIEEQILALHGEKRALVADVLAGTSRAAQLSTRDLVALIQESALAAPAAEAQDNEK